MSSSTHQIQLKGVDKTGAAFGSVRNRAAATGAQIRSMLGGALAAAGAYLGLRSIKGGIDELGHLSDIAQKTNTNVKDLTQTAAALNVLGIQNMGVDQIGKAFDYMAKSTGRTGMAGFYQTIEELGKIPDVAKRSQEAVKVFGRSGMEFMPLINAAKDGAEAFKAVSEAMAGVSQQAAEVGDSVKDASDIIKNKFNVLWQEGIAAFAKLIHGDIRSGAAAIGEYMEYGAKLGWRYLKAFFQNGENGVKRYKQVWESLKDYVINSMIALVVVAEQWAKSLPDRIGIGFGNAVYSIAGIFNKGLAEKGRAFTDEWAKDISREMWRNVDKELKRLGIDASKDLSGGVTGAVKDAFDDVKTDDLKKGLEDGLKRAKALSENMRKAVSSGVGSAGDSKSGIGDKDGRRLVAEVLKTPQIRNDLITSINEANRIAMLGPQLQSETKKQTEILSKVEAGVREVADAVKKIEVPEAING